MDPKTGDITPTVGDPVRTKEPTATVVKVGTKPKVETTTDPEGRTVTTTTTYTVDPNTGTVTPTTTTTYGPTSKKGEPEVQTETPEYTNPISSNGVDGNGNLIDPPTVELSEFNGGVNGELPDPIPSLELTIEVRWIDEDGNTLKPSVKTGNEKDAEHGSIPGYEFVRTVIDGNEPVMTHIFRKVGSNTNTIPVAPVTPDTNGGSGQDTPAPTPTTPIPDAVTPNANHEDTTDASDNGAKSNDSQNVLPNTGTESNATLASLGLLGMLGGLGLALGKKKED